MSEIKLYNEDCIAAMEKISPNSINLIVTDPPYNLGHFMKNRDTNLSKMRDNFFGAAGWDDMGLDEWKKSMDDFFESAAKVMKKGGTLIMFMAIIKVETIIGLAEKHGFYYKTTGIWHKTNPMPRNNNLEQQALTLFKAFFIDYQPYKGTVPLSWQRVSLDEVCTKITDGAHYSPIDTPNAPYPMYSVKDMETYGFTNNDCKHITKSEFAKMKKNDCVPLPNDILVAKDGSYLKEVFICSEYKECAILSSIAIFRPNNNIIVPEILLYLLKQPSIKKDVGDNYVSGSALPRIVLKDFKKNTFILPPMVEQIKISTILHEITRKIQVNTDEIKVLSSLRDYLLPKLISGEISVSKISI